MKNTRLVIFALYSDSNKLMSSCVYILEDIYLEEIILTKLYV